MARNASNIGAPSHQGGFENFMAHTTPRSHSA